jgi:hypothetical protein
VAASRMVRVRFFYTARAANPPRACMFRGHDNFKRCFIWEIIY